ncbi:SBBP repeat-containing protein [Leptospira ilyithenensis]|uniref:Beta-propeller repeat protein n=1 Tax=Leptospira ilyithenensis TaxID=2484901 RepID=A0A4R9LSN5_9LEPT|nr:SBBP repeat-containing protein [Leptospira ilyithenensis]TGN11902.1 hypothetical protein EHS11_05170 [Leptospira ilyithenensis]
MKFFVKTLLVTFTISLLCLGCSSKDNKDRKLLPFLALSMMNNDSPWTRLFGAPSKQTTGRGVSVGPQGNIYTTGDTDSILEGQPSDNKTGNLFVIKHDSNGNKLWTKFLGVTGKNTYSDAISSDSQGNVYITGVTEGELDGQTLTGVQDLFVVKYDSDGNKLWTRLLGASGKKAFSRDIIITSQNNVYITGDTDGNLDNQTLTGNIDSFIAKYDSNGNRLWTKLSGVSNRFVFSESISTDSQENLYIAGHTDGNLDNQTLTGRIDSFAVKYDSNGNKLWTRLLGTSGKETIALGIFSDPEGDAYITGYTDGNLDGNSLTGTKDLFVTKYDANGSKLWTKLLGAPGKETRAYRINVGSKGYLYVTGFTQGDLDGQPRKGSQDPFVVKYDANGVKLWTRLLGGSSSEIRSAAAARDIAIDRQAKNIYITGDTNGDIDGQKLTGTKDLFLLKIANESR